MVLYKINTPVKKAKSALRILSLHFQQYAETRGSPFAGNCLAHYSLWNALFQSLMHKGNGNPLVSALITGYGPCFTSNSKVKPHL